MTGSNQEQMIQHIWIRIIAIVMNNFLSFVIIRMQISLKEEKSKYDCAYLCPVLPRASMTVFAVISHLKRNTGLVSSIARCRFLSKNQFVFGVNTELSPIVLGVARRNPHLVQRNGLVSKDKEAKIDTLPTVLIHPEHVGDFFQSHSLG